MEAYPELWRLLKESKFQEAQVMAEAELANAGNPELHVVLAWCHYRNKRYNEAWAEADKAGDDPRAVPIRMYVLAYSEPHRNDKLLMELADWCRGNIDSANALVIRARAKDTEVTHDAVWRMVAFFAETAEVADRQVSTANLLHNAARFFMEKPRDRADLKFALGLLVCAKAHYGETGHWHHRAALAFWTSHVMEKLGAIPDAFKQAFLSVELWMAQCEVDDSVEPHRQKLENAQVRLSELAVKAVAFALQKRVLSN